MATSPLPELAPVGQPSSNPLFRAFDMLTGGMAGVVTGDNIKRGVRNQQLRAAIEEQARRAALQNEMDNYFERESSAAGIEVPRTPDGRVDRVQAGALLAAAQQTKAVTTASAIRKSEEDEKNAKIDRQRGAVPGAPTTPVAPAAAPAAPAPFKQPAPVGNPIMQSIMGGLPKPAAAPVAAPAPAMNADQERLAWQQRQDADKKTADRQEAATMARDAANATTASKELTEYREAFGAEPTPDHLDASGRLNAVALKLVNDAKEKSKLTLAQKNALAAVDQGIKAGTIPAEERERALAMANSQMMGRFPAFPTNERDAAVSNALQMQGLGALNAEVAKSRASGADDFGPVAHRMKLAMGSVFGGPKYDTARNIDQLWKEVGAAKAFGEGGKQLTEKEAELTFGQVGYPTSNDFPSRLETYTARRRNVVELQLQRLEESPYRYTVEGQSAIRQLREALDGKHGGAESMGGKSPAAPAPAANPADDILAQFGITAPKP